MILRNLFFCNVPFVTHHYTSFFSFLYKKFENREILILSDWNLLHTHPWRLGRVHAHPMQNTHHKTESIYITIIETYMKALSQVMAIPSANGLWISKSVSIFSAIMYRSREGLRKQICLKKLHETLLILRASPI